MRLGDNEAKLSESDKAAELEDETKTITTEKDAETSTTDSTVDETADEDPPQEKKLMPLGDTEDKLLESDKVGEVDTESDSDTVRTGNLRGKTLYESPDVETQ